ncbi:MAG: PEP-CTERM sorting domain-containing protein [Planctomycetota bacterium]|nr:PEP-CTERM sorting domain-containing protein [Planctomycetota bacterium]
MSAKRYGSVVVVGIALAVLCIGSAAQGAVIYQENFNSYGDGTLMTAVPGWYNWTSYGGVSPTIIGGKAIIDSGKAYMALNMTDIFSYGNTQATIEFDLKSYQQEDFRFGPGTVTPGSQSSVSSQSIGFQHGSNLLYHTNGAFDYGSQVTNVPNPLTSHWVWSLSKAGTLVTWSATYDGNPLLLQGDGTHSLNITDARGFNTMRWYTLGASMSELDNIVITAIPEPATMSLLALGGVSALIRRRNRR